MDPLHRPHTQPCHHRIPVKLHCAMRQETHKSRCRVDLYDEKSSLKHVEEGEVGGAGRR